MATRPSASTRGESEPRAQVVRGRRADDADVDEAHAPGNSLDDPEAAPGQAGVDAQHPHRRTSVRTEHQFGRAYGPGGGVPGRRARSADALEDLDDVQNVWANFDISDEVLERVG